MTHPCSSLVTDNHLRWNTFFFFFFFFCHTYIIARSDQHSLWEYEVMVLREETFSVISKGWLCVRRVFIPQMGRYRLSDSSKSPILHHRSESTFTPLKFPKYSLILINSDSSTPKTKERQCCGFGWTFCSICWWLSADKLSSDQNSPPFKRIINHPHIWGRSINPVARINFGNLCFCKPQIYWNFIFL